MTDDDEPKPHRPRWSLTTEIRVFHRTIEIRVFHRTIVLTALHGNRGLLALRVDPPCGHPQERASYGALGRTPATLRQLWGRHWLYFGQGRADGGWDIWYAESSDGLAWTVRGIALAGTASQSEPEFIIRGASLVHLASGQWRMYYQAAPTRPSVTRTAENAESL